MYRQHPGCKNTVWRCVPDYGYQTFNVLVLNFFRGLIRSLFFTLFIRDNQTEVTHF